MFILKPAATSPTNKYRGNFVDNLRSTIEILTYSCKWVPKTAFKRTTTTTDGCSSHVTIPRPNTAHSVTWSQQLEMEMEVEDCVVLDEPVGAEERWR